MDCLADVFGPGDGELPPCLRPGGEGGSAAEADAEATTKTTAPPPQPEAPSPKKKKVWARLAAALAEPLDSPAALRARDECAEASRKVAEELRSASYLAAPTGRHLPAEDAILLSRVRGRQRRGLGVKQQQKSASTAAAADAAPNPAPSPTTTLVICRCCGATLYADCYLRHAAPCRAALARVKERGERAAAEAAARAKAARAVAYK